MADKAPWMRVWIWQKRHRNIAKGTEDWKLGGQRGKKNKGDIVGKGKMGRREEKDCKR